MRILYIGGTSRTGSTLLTSLLGQYPQFFSAGELAFLWRYSLLQGGLCECGTELRVCPTWRSIFEEAFGGIENVDASEMVRLRKRFNSNHLPLMVSQGVRDRMLRRTGELPNVLTRLYQGMRSATGSNVIVDSSKEPHYSYILRSQPELDVYFLHLVRDPRAIAHSWRRRKEETGFGGGAFMATRRPANSCLYFNVSNLASEALWDQSSDRYMFLRYEDLMASPAEALFEIGRFIGVKIDPGHVIHDGYATLQTTHSAWGNPNRFRHGRVKLELEDEWRSRMPASDRAVVTALTLPLLLHYGYPVRTLSERSRSVRAGASSEI